MTEGASGPLHVFDSEQIWTVLKGECSVHIAGKSEILGPGDTVVMPPARATGRRSHRCPPPCLRSRRRYCTGTRRARATRHTHLDRVIDGDHLDIRPGTFPSTLTPWLVMTERRPHR